MTLKTQIVYKRNTEVYLPDGKREFRVVDFYMEVFFEERNDGNLPGCGVWWTPKLKQGEYIAYISGMGQVVLLTHPANLNQHISGMGTVTQMDAK